MSENPYEELGDEALAEALRRAAQEFNALLEVAAQRKIHVSTERRLSDGKIAVSRMWVERPL